MTVTDKFAKAVRLIPGKNTYTAPDWATMFWQAVYPDWGLPSAIISDRDPKFLSEFWKTLFDKAGTKILTSTAYHPETDGQSERTNQTIEIALRYYISARQHDWADALHVVQASILTAKHTTTGKTPAEILYGFNPSHAIELGNPTNTVSDEWAKLREINRKDAADAIGHAQAMMKLAADERRQEFQLAVGDKAYLRLHKGYHLPGIPKAKIGQQRVGPFEVENVVGSNAYKLKLPAHWKIWPVISGIYLDKAPDGADPYDRMPKSQPVEVTEDEILNSGDRWEVAAIVRKRVLRKNVQYLVRWSGFGPEEDSWLNEEELAGCSELIQDYENAVGNKEWKPPSSWT